MIATVWPGKVPVESYRRFYASRPMVRPTLLALSTCGLVGMLLNDAGVALPAIMTGFALPLLVAHLLAASVVPESHLVQESQSVDRHRQ
jgi:membrane-bound ClpP family serine protease